MSALRPQTYRRTKFVLMRKSSAEMGMIMARSAAVERKTRETDISLELELDGTGKSEINTGIGFFDHMLTSFARHGFFDLKLTVKGDLYVDGHHTVEDTGIVLGKAIRQALRDKV